MGQNDRVQNANQHVTHNGKRLLKGHKAFLNAANFLFGCFLVLLKILSFCDSAFKKTELFAQPVFFVLSTCPAFVHICKRSNKLFDFVPIRIINGFEQPVTPVSGTALC